MTEGITSQKNHGIQNADSGAGKQTGGCSNAVPHPTEISQTSNLVFYDAASQQPSRQAVVEVRL